MRITEELIIDVDNYLYSGPCHFVIIDNTELLEPYVNTFVKMIIDEVGYDAYVSMAVVEESGREPEEIITCYILTDAKESFHDKEIIII